MTFKHIKFEDSPIMRSLEKVAKEKGLVKPESVLQKLASRPAVKKVDATPSTNLMENIFKLCEGLRSQGLVAEANELEVNYFQFKQAQTLYEAHKEKGEDLIHAAHPDGSHKLEGVEGDEACFEDILDQQVKTLQKIQKKPTGKLESNAHVLSEVKKALGGLTEFTASQLGGSAWPRLLSFLGRSAPTIELAGGGEAAAGAGAVGAGEGAAAVGVGAMGTVAGAALVGAIGGAIAGNALFNHYLAPDDLKDAGEKLIEKCKDLKGDLPAAANSARQDFEIAFSKAMTNYAVIADLQSSKNPADLPKLKELSDQLWKTNKVAQTIWGWAQSATDASWKPSFLPGGPSGVVALAKNYMDRTNEITSLIDKFVRDAAQIAGEKMQQQTASKGGQGVVDLEQGYSETAAQLEKYKAIIQAKQMPNANALLDWISKIERIINSEYSKFKKVPDANKADVASFYAERLNNKIKPKVKAFADKWMA